MGCNQRGFNAGIVRYSFICYVVNHGNVSNALLERIKRCDPVGVAVSGNLACVGNWFSDSRVHVCIKPLIMEQPLDDPAYDLGYVTVVAHSVRNFYVYRLS